MLLAISSLGKQNLIFSYTWLKNYNLEVDWEKNKVLMTRYLPYYEGCQILWKEQLWKEQALKKRQKV